MKARSMKWHAMSRADLAAVSAVAGRVHPGYPEDESVFLERLTLYPRGCFVLKSEHDLIGYLISHPWHFADPPGLNVLLTSIPAEASTYYIHDVAFLPEARGSHSASNLVRDLIEDVSRQGFPSMSLIAVNNSQGFWERLGFKVYSDAKLKPKLDSYGAGARFMVLELGKTASPIESP